MSLYIATPYETLNSKPISTENEKSFSSSLSEHIVLILTYHPNHPGRYRVISNYRNNAYFQHHCIL